MKRDNPFHIATPEEIIAGETTDVYFERTLQILKARRIDKRVVAEVRARELPERWPWAVCAGMDEVLALLERLRINVKVNGIEEGTVFGAGDVVFSIEGRYNDFCLYETAILGFLCQASGIATAAARCKKAAGERVVLSFGARRMHPALTPMIDRSAYIGGVDGVSALLSARMLKIVPSGTMPHALVLLMGDTVEATRAFRNIIAKKTKCISLIDTFNDEKFEALNVARGMGKALYGMRIDTPASRRGDLAAILAEVRWELDLRGFKQVKIFVSGGLDELKIAELNPWTDGYGIGTRIAGAPVVDFSYDIVEIDGTPVAKRGKEAGAKKLMRCPRCLGRSNSPARAKAVRCACGARMESIHEVLMRDGKPVRRSDAVAKIRGRTLREVKKLTF